VSAPVRLFPAPPFLSFLLIFNCFDVKATEICKKSDFQEIPPLFSEGISPDVFEKSFKEWENKF